MSQTTDAGRLNVGRLGAGLRRLVEREDRAGLAALRRGLGKRPGEAPEMFAVLVPLLPDGRLHADDEETAYLIASLFASHPASWAGDGDGRWSRNFGASLRRLGDATTSQGADRRMTGLLGSDRERLDDQLRSAVHLLRSKGIPVDWEQLTWDTLQWDRPDRVVQRRWASAFWASPAATEAGESGDRPE